MTPSKITSTAATSVTSTTFFVDGMTCDHCVRAVTDELTAVPGVTEVSIELRPGASSPVTVASTRPLAEPEVREAVDEAGYELHPAVS